MSFASRVEGAILPGDVTRPNWDILGAMLLVAVTGSIGAGKSTALLEFGTQLARAGQSIDGFVAIAGARDELGRGAADYTLRMLADSQEMVFATRQAIGYRIEESTLLALAEWAKAVPFAKDVLILDEFGRWEATGEGHWPLWPTLVGARPKMVVIGIRPENIAPIEERLGRRFDLIVSAEDDSVVQRLLDVAAQRPDWERVGKFGAGSGALEMTIGAALHTVKFPLTGMAMSAAQAGVLTVAGDGLAMRQRVVWVSFIASGLKALSPSGSKLGPMLAIAMQGLLYTLSTMLLGWNAIGVFVGGALMGAWASSQGVFVQYLMLGNGIEKAYGEVVKWFASRFSLQLPGLIALIVLVVCVNAALAGIVAVTMWRRRARLRTQLEAWIERPKTPVNLIRRKGVLALSLFVPTVLVAAILASTGTEWADIALMAGRAIGVALLLFALIQRWNPVRLIGYLQRKGKWGPAYALSSALEARENGKP